MDLRVAWSLTVRRSPRVGAVLFIRGRRSTRSGGDRYRGGRGGQQKRGVVHCDSHGDVPFASTCFSARRGVDADAPESEWRDRRRQATASAQSRPPLSRWKRSPSHPWQGLHEQREFLALAES